MTNIKFLINSVLHEILAGDVLEFKKTAKKEPKPQQNKDQSEYDFKLKSSFLRSTSPLNKGELKQIEDEVDRVSALIDKCDPTWDSDVLDNLDAYLDQIQERLQISIKVKKEEAEQQNKSAQKISKVIKMKKR